MSKLLQCSRQRCAKPPRFDGLCAIHARKLADGIFSKFIRARDERCQATMGDVLCGLPYDLQCAHLIPRRYLAVRWSPDNAVALCMFHHKKWTENPLAWDQWCEERLGEQSWSSMKRRALQERMPDLGVIIADLKLMLAEVAA